MLQVVNLRSEKAFEIESTFNYLLEGLNYELKTINDDVSTFKNVLIIYSSMSETLPIHVKDFVENLKCPYSLFHMSNEWGWAYYPKIRNYQTPELSTQHHYGNASHIFRSYWNPIFDCDKVTHLPIFWQNGFLNNEKVIKNNKIYKTSFIGNSNKNDRKKVISIMKSMGDCFIHETSGWMSDDIISVDKQAEVYSQSVICPCPMGGCHPEVFRMCEILESNSIPVIVEYFDFEYHNRVYGYDSPIPKIKFWEDLPKVYKDITTLGVNYTTERIQTWYKDWKQKTKINFQKILLSLGDRN